MRPSRRLDAGASPCVDRRKACRARTLAVRGRGETTECQNEDEQREANENWAILFERRQGGDPRPADPEREQHQWRDAAERPAKGRRRASDQ